MPAPRLILLTSLACILLAVPWLYDGTRLFFYPSRQRYVDPRSLPIPPQELRFNGGDGTQLNGWLFRNSNGDKHAPLILQFHGNAENMTTHFESLYWLVERGFNLMVFDYRGYGASAGKAEIHGVIKDAEAALREAVRLVDNQPRRLILYGQSLGGNLALHALGKLSSRQAVRAVVIESGFWSYQNVAQAILADTWLTWPFQWLGVLLINKSHDPAPLAQVGHDVPFLVMHARHDPIVPFQQGRQLFAQLPIPKCFWSIEGQGHINTMLLNRGAWREPLVEFLQDSVCTNKP